MIDWKPLEGKVVQFTSKWEARGFVHTMHTNYGVPIAKDIWTQLNSPSITVGGRPYYQIWFTRPTAPGLNTYINQYCAQNGETQAEFVSPDTFEAICDAIRNPPAAEAAEKPVRGNITIGPEYITHEGYLVKWADVTEMFELYYKHKQQQKK